MKKTLAVLLPVFLLLTGCCCNLPEIEPEGTDLPPVASVPEIQTLPVVTQAPTEATEPEVKMVTVYLIEKISYYDSGFASFHYDENYNITSYESVDIENNPMFTVYFEQCDGNGLAAKVRTDWNSGGSTSSILTYTADGKIDSVLEDGSNFCGYQYAYDENGNLSEKRFYYDGILENTVIHEYNGKNLAAVYCEDPDGNLIYDTELENGRILKQIYYDSDTDYCYINEYDANGNLINRSFLIDAEEQPVTQYEYKAVEVPEDRVPYILTQQNYLIGQN